MAKAAGSKQTSNLAAKFANRPKKKRPGVHSKKKASKLKSSKNYFKRKKGQGS